MREIFLKRIEELRKLMQSKAAHGLLISRCENFAWLTFGGRSHITLRETEGVASVLITADRIQIFVNNIERQRLFKEEIPEEITEFFEPFEYSWWETERPFIVPYIEEKKVLSDTGRYGTEAVDLTEFRLVLSEPEIKNYRNLGKTVDRILEKIGNELTPELSELEVEGMIYKAFMTEDIEPILGLVFSDKSALEYRHNLPRNLKLGKKAFFSVCARQRGLVVSSTRSVLFDNNPGFIDQHRRNCLVDAAAIAFSRPGIKLSEVFSKIQESFGEAGFAQEWKKHHQGGLAGYLSREMVASPYGDYLMRPGNAIAWNPTIKGTKSEDTAIIGESGNEIISYPDNSNWPEISFEINGQTIRRPDILLK